MKSDEISELEHGIAKHSKAHVEVSQGVAGCCELAVRNCALFRALKCPT